jgi:hypothetical protein
MTFIRSRVKLIAAFAVVALGTAAFGWTSSPVGGLASSVTIEYGGGQFAGIVTAEQPCVEGRQVTVNNVADGNSVGTAITDSVGEWSLAASGVTGDFAATVLASTVGGDSYGYNATTCDQGTSNTITVKKHKKHHKKHHKKGGSSLQQLIKRMKKLFPDFDFSEFRSLLRSLSG